MRGWRMVEWASVVVVLLVGSAMAWGQALVDRVPEDAMVYVGWKGSGSMGAGYEGSHLKAVIDATDWGKVFSEFVPAIMEKVGKGNPDAAEKMRVVAALAGPMWRHESAFYFGGMIAGQGGPPAPKLAVLVRAGDEAGALVKEIKGVLEMAGRTPVEIKVARYGDIVAVTTGAWPGFESLLGAQVQAPAAGALKNNEKFKAAMGQVQGDPVSVVYVDGEAIVKMVDGFVALGMPVQQQQMWRKARQIIGLGGVRQMVFAGGFDGKDWMCEGFVGASTPRQGLMALLDSGKLTDEILKLVPEDVTMVSAGRFDLAGLVAHAKASAAEADPQWGEMVNGIIGQGSQWAGFDLEKDLLATLGEEWGVYASPKVGGIGMLGMCVVNRPKDAEKLESSLGMLEKRGNEALGQLLRGQATVAFKTRQVDGVTLHYLAVPILTPTWAVANGTLYVGLFPQVVLGAVDYGKQGGPTVLQNEKFAAMRQRLSGEKAISSVSFSDLPRTAPNAYASWLLISRYAGVADIFGIDSPLMLVPPMNRLMPELAPSGQVSWSDEAGWHIKGVTPFPGADVLGQDPVATFMTAEPAVMISILLPSLNRARETANRVKSASNLRQIGAGMLLYSNEHRGAFPKSLGELATTEDLQASVFVSPSSNTSAPRDVLEKDKLAEWVNENSDFVYMGEGKTTRVGPEDILAYEKPDIHGRGGFNILYGDGHVDFVDREWGMKLVAQQEEKDRKAK